MHDDLFFFNDTATTEIYTLSLHDALPIFDRALRLGEAKKFKSYQQRVARINAFEPELELLDDHELREGADELRARRSEEHTSELQSRQYLVCRLLLEKKKTTRTSNRSIPI